MKYDYKEAVTDDVYEYIKNNFNLEDYAGARDRLIKNIDEKVTFEVSGQAAGSYTCDAYKAKKNLTGNEDLIISAYRQLDMEDKLPHINGKLVDEEDLIKYMEFSWEDADLYIRTAIASSCIEDALQRIEKEMDIDLDDDRTFARTFVLQIYDELPDNVFSDIKDYCEDALFENDTLVLYDITPQEFGEITSNLEYENIAFGDKSNEKMFVVYEMVGNFSHEAFRTDIFNEAQDYLTNRENEARVESEKNDEEFDSQDFYSYFSIDETTVGDLAKLDKENPDSKKSTQQKSRKSGIEFDK